MQLRGGCGCAAWQDLTWFINPNSPDYFDQIHLEHGYIHGEVNATTLHITVRRRSLPPSIPSAWHPCYVCIPACL